MNLHPHSPVNFRRSLLRVICSPGGLALCFVMLLIVACPGSRGDGAVELLISQDAAAGGFGAPGSVTSISVDQLTAAATAPAHRFADTGTPSFGRSKTPAEKAKANASAAVAHVDAFRRMRNTLPMLAAPLPGMPGFSSSLEPMIGTSVGSNDIVATDSAR